MYCIPTSTAIDGLSFERDSEGIALSKNRSFDRWVVRRAITKNGVNITREPVKVEIKTNTTPVYDDDILMIKMSEIAGTRNRIPLLQHTLIEDSKGNPAYKGIVRSAYGVISSKVDQHIKLQQPKE